MLAFWLAACEQKPPTISIKADSVVTRDVHSLSNYYEVMAEHLDLDIKVDFTTQVISGKASWDINNPTNLDFIVFDTRLLNIEKVTLGDDEAPAKFSLAPDVKYLGKALRVELTTGVKKVNIYYCSSKDAPALQWLNPVQTAGKKKPFLFTQSESILARTWVPCQDGPGNRFTYEAKVTVPPDLLALMSAENPTEKNAEGKYHFKQNHPIPSYLLALAVGDIAFKAIDKRTGVYAEPVVLSKAAWEFADMGKMVDAAEKLYGPYRWGRYDVLVLPPSFPFGGMENPNLTFATPTVIAGDRSLVSLIAHELAHSWSGNLVTNASWSDIWLNEGFTTYFERRIVEAVYGKPEAEMQEVLGRQLLDNVVAEMGPTSEDTRLKPDLTGRDPDDGLTEIPYEKGYAFIRTIEEATGRKAFDEFLKEYFDKHAFQSRTTEQFLADLNQNLIKKDSTLEGKIRTKDWVYQPGIPGNAPFAKASVFTSIDSILLDYRKNEKSRGPNKNLSSTNELLYFISHLPENLTVGEMTSLDRQFNFTNSGNAEVQCDWYVLAVRHQYKVAYPQVKKFLTEVGRRKFIVPIYKELLKSEHGKKMAKQIYAKARANYHPVAYQTIDDLLK